MGGQNMWRFSLFVEGGLPWECAMWTRGVELQAGIEWSVEWRGNELKDTVYSFCAFCLFV